MTRPKRAERPGAADPFNAETMAEIFRPAIAKAREGDLEALSILERHLRLSDRPIKLDLPPITDAKSVADAQAQVIALLNKQRIGPRRAHAVSTIIEYRRRALETVEYEAQLDEIEDNRSQAAKLIEEFQARMKR